MKKFIPFILLIASAVYIITALMNSGSVNPDALIYIRYTQNLINTGVYSFNLIPEATLGNNSFLYPFLLALPYSLFNNPLHAAVFTSVLWGVLFLTILYFVLKSFSTHINTLLICSVIAAYIVFITPFTDQMINGVETTLSVCLLTFFIYGINNRKHHFTYYILLSLLALAIYEVNFVSLYFILFFPLLYFYDRKRTLLFYYTPVIGFILIDALIKISFFGKAFPSSILSLRSVFNDDLSPYLINESIRASLRFFFYFSPFFVILLINVKRRTFPYLITSITFILFNLYFFSFSEDKVSFLYLLVPFLITGAVKTIDSIAAEKNFNISDVADMVPKLAIMFGIIIASIVFYNKIAPQKENKGVPVYNQREILELATQGSKIILPIDNTIFNIRNLNIKDFWGQHVNGSFEDHLDYFRHEKPDIIVFPSRRLFNNLNVIKDSGFKKDYIFLSNLGESGIAISRKDPEYAKQILEELRNRFSQLRRRNNGIN